MPAYTIIITLTVMRQFWQLYRRCVWKLNTLMIYRRPWPIQVHHQYCSRFALAIHVLIRVISGTHELYGHNGAVLHALLNLTTRLSRRIKIPVYIHSVQISREKLDLIPAFSVHTVIYFICFRLDYLRATLPVGYCVYQKSIFQLFLSIG